MHIMVVRVSVSIQYTSLSSAERTSRLKKIRSQWRHPVPFLLLCAVTVDVTLLNSTWLAWNWFLCVSRLLAGLWTFPVNYDSLQIWVCGGFFDTKKDLQRSMVDLLVCSTGLLIVWGFTPNATGNVKLVLEYPVISSKIVVWPRFSSGSTTLNCGHTTIVHT